MPTLMRSAPRTPRDDAFAAPPSPHPAGDDVPAPRYGRVAAWLHWALAVALLAQIAFGLLLDEIAPRGTPARSGVINLHKSLGIVLGLLIVVRIAWRLAHAPPPWPSTMTEARRRAARLGHLALYLCMLVAPLAGYLGSNLSPHGVRFFGVALAPWGPDRPAAYKFLINVHDVTTYALLALVTGHIAMALKHAFIERDGIFARIAP
ncbi:MAG: cytochrome b [Caldimonas sp.]